MDKWVLFATILLTLFFSACSTTTPSPPPNIPTQGAPWLKVTESVNLYSSADAHAAVIGTLSAGTVLKPANNAKKYDCVLVKEIDPEHSLCHVEVVNTGETGWFISAWEWLEAVTP